MSTNGLSLKWSPRVVLSKYDDDMVDFTSNILDVYRPTGDQLAECCTPYETVEVEGNLLTTAGLTRVTQLLIGTSTGTLDSTRARLGVGDTATAAVVGDTSLGTNQFFRVFDATYPNQSTCVITFQSSFGSAEANFAWQCWGIDVGTPTVTSSATPATLVNRKVSSFGTKSSGTWVLNVTITFS